MWTFVTVLALVAAAEAGRDRLSSAAVSETHLVRYGCELGQEDGTITSVGPPELTVFNDGRFVVRRGRRFVEGRLDTSRLGKLRKVLKRSALLSESRFMTEGKEAFTHHGAACYFLYSTPERTSTVIASFYPAGRRWSRLRDRLFAATEGASVPYRPPRIEIRVARTSARYAAEPWPPGASDTPEKLGSLGQVTEDPALIAAFFGDDRYSSVRTFRYDGVPYRVWLRSVPELLEPERLAALILSHR